MQAVSIKRALFAAAMMAAASIAGAQVMFRAGTQLTPTADATQLVGCIVAIPGGAAEVLSVPDGTRLNMHFYRFDTRMNRVVARGYSLGGLSFYGPTLCWNGQGFGVVASTITRSVFVVLDLEGNAVLGPMELPGLPYGGRTAAFKIVWTGAHYAVFGMWLEKSHPLQDIAYGHFYTHLHYWLLNPDGTAAVHRELAMLAPMSYPGSEGTEKAYYDVVWTGRSLFLVYYAESQSGPPLGGYYKIFDVQGNLVAGERPVFASQVTQGARLAWNGRTVAATGLKAISIPNPGAGNYMYLRCFDPDGTPRGPETQYGQLLGFGPTVFAVADRFVTIYPVIFDWNTLQYTLMLNEFDEFARPLRPEYPAAAPDGTVLLGRQGLGFDLQVTSGPDLLYGMAMTSDAFYIQSHPFSFVLRYRPPDWPRLTWARPGNDWLLQWPDDALGYRLLEAPGPGGGWLPVAAQPAEVDGHYRLAVPLGDTRFYRLAPP